MVTRCLRSLIHSLQAPGDLFKESDIQIFQQRFSFLFTGSRSYARIIMAFIRELALPVLAFTLALSFCEVQVSSQVTGRPFFITNVSSNPGTNQLSDSRTSKLSPVSFNEVFNVLWGADHQRLFKDQSGIEIWLDKNSGNYFFAFTFCFVSLVLSDFYAFCFFFFCH